MELLLKKWFITMEILFPTILVQAAVTVFLLWTSSKSKTEDNLLFLIMCTFLLHIGFKYVLWLYYSDGQAYNKMHGSFSLLYGPFLLFYFMSVTGNNLKSVFRKLSFGPFIFAFLLNVVLIFQILRFNDYYLLDLYTATLLTLGISSNLLYSGFVLWRSFQIKSEDVVLRYKLRIARIIAVVIVIPVFLFVVNNVIGLSINSRITWYITILVMYVFVLQARFKIYQLSSLQTVAQPILLPSKKYANSSLEEKDKVLILQRLSLEMDKNKLFRDSDLSLERLSTALNIPKSHLTEILNNTLGMNFYQYINHRRVEDAKEEIRLQTDSNLISIAFDCGFKSKSTFNKYFKELTGLSPSEYRERLFSQMSSVG